MHSLLIIDLSTVLKFQKKTFSEFCQVFKKSLLLITVVTCQAVYLSSQELTIDTTGDSSDILQNFRKTELDVQASVSSYKFPWIMII